MRFVLIAILVSVVYAKSSCDPSEFYAKTSVVDLCDSHFPNKSSEYTWMVEFYAPWCGHCKALKPKYIEAAKKAKKDTKLEGIKFGAVDCTKEQSLCQKYGVKGYPTLKAFVGGKAKEYMGQRESEDLLSFMSQLKESRGTKGGSSKCSSPLVDAKNQDAVPLCDAHFPDKKSKNSWVVAFHTDVDKSQIASAKKNLYDLATKVVEGGAKVGLVDCSSSSAFCESKLGSQKNLETGITVKTFLKGQTELSTQSFDGDFSDTSSVLSFVKKQLGSKFKLPSSQNDEL